MLLKWCHSKWFFALERAFYSFYSRTFCLVVLILISVAESALASSHRAVEFCRLEKVKVLSLYFLLLECLSTERALLTLLHPVINAFFTIGSFAIFSATNHVLCCDARANRTYKFFNNSSVLLNCLIKRQFFFSDLFKSLCQFTLMLTDFLLDLGN